MIEETLDALAEELVEGPEWSEDFLEGTGLEWGVTVCPRCHNEKLLCLDAPACGECEYARTGAGSDADYRADESAFTRSRSKAGAGQRSRHRPGSHHPKRPDRKVYATPPKDFGERKSRAKASAPDLVRLGATSEASVWRAVRGERMLPETLESCVNALVRFEAEPKPVKRETVRIPSLERLIRAGKTSAWRLAYETGLAPDTIYRIKNHGGRARHVTAIKIADGLGVPFEELLKDHGSRPAA